MLMYFDALKDQFDCDLEQLKSTVIIDKLEKDGSVVDTIEPSLWASCGITKPLHKIMLAKAIRRLAGKKAHTGPTKTGPAKTDP